MPGPQSVLWVSGMLWGSGQVGPDSSRSWHAWPSKQDRRQWADTGHPHIIANHGREKLRWACGGPTLGFPQGEISVRGNVGRGSPISMPNLPPGSGQRRAAKIAQAWHGMEWNLGLYRIAP